MLGIDAAFSRINREAFREFYLLGHRVFMQNLWTGGYQNNEQLRAVAEDNLKDASLEGFSIGAYINANPWRPASVSLSEAKLNAGSMWDKLSVLALDVEITGTTETQIAEHLEALKSTGKKTCIYSAHWFWTAHLNDTATFGDEPLWLARYDSNPDMSVTGPLFGGWTVDDVAGKQFNGSTEVGGVEVDLNSFTDFFLGDVVPPTIEQRLERIEFMLRKSGVEMASMSDINLLEAIRESQVAIKALIQSSQLPPEILKEWLGDSK